MARYIGIRHRVKQTTEGEARPTQVAIMQNGSAATYELPDDTAELDWVLGRFPVRFRPVIDGDDLSGFLPHHVVYRALRKDESIDEYAENRRKLVEKRWHVAMKVPMEFDGLAPEDSVAMVLGGSGDRLAYALSRRADETMSAIYRIPPFTLKERRPTDDKDLDAPLLAQLVRDEPNMFYKVTLRDRDLILLRETLFARNDAMKARIGCEQRLRQHFIGNIFCNSAGRYPEGSIEKMFDEYKANDQIMQALLAEEAARDKELARVCNQLYVFQALFDPIEGVGPAIASRLISSIGDIRRFATNAKLKAFLGVHVMEDGRFVRRRSGELANWHPEGRQALYLLGDQFNRRPNSDWGKKLLHYKAELRRKHPDVEVVDGKKRYTDGHIHKMALWRTLTKFVEWLWKEWSRLEERRENIV